MSCFPVDGERERVSKTEKKQVDEEERKNYREGKRLMKEEVILIPCAGPV